MKATIVGEHSRAVMGDRCGLFTSARLHLPIPPFLSLDRRPTSPRHDISLFRRAATGDKCPMPQQHTAISPLTTLFIAAFLLLSLFPGIFISILWAPYNSLSSYYFPPATPRSTVLCSSPNICTTPSTMSWYATTSQFFPRPTT